MNCILYFVRRLSDDKIVACSHIKDDAWDKMQTRRHKENYSIDYRVNEIDVNEEDYNDDTDRIEFKYDEERAYARKAGYLD